MKRQHPVWKAYLNAPKKPKPPRVSLGNLLVLLFLAALAVAVLLLYWASYSREIIGWL